MGNQRAIFDKIAWLKLRFDSSARRKVTGHLFASLCKLSAKSKKIVPFLGQSGLRGKKDIWSIDLTLNNSSVHFKIDTRADITVIPKSVYKKLKPTPALVQSSKTLFGAAHTTLPILGCFMGIIKRGEESL